MKRHIFPLVLVLVLLMGCATVQEQTFESTAYQSLFTAAQSYQFAYNSYLDLKGQGRLSPSTIAKFDEGARVFRAAYHSAVSALEAYKAGNLPDARVDALLGKVGEAIAPLLDLVNTYLEEKING